MPEFDPLHSLWTRQKEEPFVMSLADIHARAERFQVRIRLRNWIEHAAAVVVIFAFSAIALATPDLGVRIAVGLIVLGVLYISWKLAAVAGAAHNDGAPWADFHRAELVRQRDALKSVWRWYLAPLVPGVTAYIAASAFSPSEHMALAGRIAFALLGCAWVGAVFGGIHWINQRAAKRLDAEIEALDRARD